MTINISGRSPASDREHRERLGISAGDFAARAGISDQELTTYEHSKTEADANPAIAVKVADTLDAFEREINKSNDSEAYPT